VQNRRRLFVVVKVIAPIGELTKAALERITAGTEVDVGERLVAKSEVLTIVPLSYAKIWQKMQDGSFPRSYRVDGKVFWKFSEILEWLANLPHQTLKGDPIREGEEGQMSAVRAARRPRTAAGGREEEGGRRGVRGLSAQPLRQVEVRRAKKER
jgi:predicted DNA-binding transcriptional regulator AlpA